MAAKMDLVKYTLPSGEKSLVRELFARAELHGMDLDAVKSTYVLASRAHADQSRKGFRGEPYLQHPVRVALTLLRMRQYFESKFPEDSSVSARTVCLALLHDVPEDNAEYWAKLEIPQSITAPCKSAEKEAEGHSFRVAVESLSRKMHPTLESYYQYVLHGKDSDLRLVKLSDRLDNVRSLPLCTGVADDPFIEKYLEETKIYYLNDDTYIARDKNNAVALLGDLLRTRIRHAYETTPERRSGVYRPAQHLVLERIVDYFRNLLETDALLSGHLEKIQAALLEQIDWKYFEKITFEERCHYVKKSWNAAKNFFMETLGPEKARFEESLLDFFIALIDLQSVVRNNQFQQMNMFELEINRILGALLAAVDKERRRKLSFWTGEELRDGFLNELFLGS
jgi:hypothetical protein